MYLEKKKLIETMSTILKTNGYEPDVRIRGDHDGFQMLSTSTEASVLISRGLPIDRNVKASWLIEADHLRRAMKSLRALKKAKEIEVQFDYFGVAGGSALSPGKQFLRLKTDIGVSIDLEARMNEHSKETWKPRFTGGKVFRIPFGRLREALKRVAFSVSSDVTRFSLNGLRIEASKKDSTVTFAATDGHRCGVVVLGVSRVFRDRSILVPIEVVNALLAEKIDLFEYLDFWVKGPVGPSLLAFRGRGFDVQGYEVQGKFPDFDKVIKAAGKGVKIQETFSVDGFSEALAAASSVTDDSHKAVVLEFTPDRLKITGPIGEGGGVSGYVERTVSKKVLPPVYDGEKVAEDGRLGLDPTLLTPFLKAISGDEFDLRVKDAKSPFLFTEVPCLADFDGAFEFVVMPMRL